MILPPQLWQLKNILLPSSSKPPVRPSYLPSQKHSKTQLNRNFNFWSQFKKKKPNYFDKIDELVY